MAVSLGFFGWSISINLLPAKWFTDVYPERRERALERGIISICELLGAFTFQRVISITEWRKADRTEAGNVLY